MHKHRKGWVNMDSIFLQYMNEQLANKVKTFREGNHEKVEIQVFVVNTLRSCYSLWDIC